MEISGEKGKSRKAVAKFYWGNVALKTAAATMFSIIAWLLVLSPNLTLAQAGVMLAMNAILMTIFEVIWPGKYSFWKDS